MIYINNCYNLFDTGALGFRKEYGQDYLGGGQTVTVSIDDADPSKELYVRMDIYLPTNGSSHMLKICGSSGTVLAGLYYTSSREMRLVKGTSISAVSSSSVLTSKKWYQMMLIFSPSTGAARLLIDGSDVASGTLSKGTASYVWICPLYYTSTNYTEIRNIIIADEEIKPSMKIVEMPVSVISSEWDIDGNVFSVQDRGKKIVLRADGSVASGYAVKGLSLVAAESFASEYISAIEAETGGRTGLAVLPSADTQKKSSAATRVLPVNTIRQDITVISRG